MAKTIVVLAAGALILVSCARDNETQEFANSGFLRVKVVADGHPAKHAVRVGLDQLDGPCTPKDCGLRTDANGRWGGYLNEGEWRLVPRAYSDIGEAEPVEVTMTKGKDTSIQINYTGKP